MQNDIPVLNSSSATPKFRDYGVYLNASSAHPGRGPGAVWLHGVLAVPPEGLAENWLGTLNVTIISEADQIPQIAPVFGGRTLLLNHFSEVTLEPGQQAWVLPFSFDLRDVRQTSAFDDHFFVHISARQYCSAPVRIARAEEELPTYLEMGGKGFRESDSLLKGYDAAASSRFPEAVEFFEKAFARNELRIDLDRLNLYNAAFCAGQAALEANPETAQQLLDKTARWLQEDLQLRNEMLKRIQQNLSTETDEDRQLRLTKKRTQLLQDLHLTRAAA